MTDVTVMQDEVAVVLTVEGVAVELAVPAAPQIVVAPVGAQGPPGTGSDEQVAVVNGGTPGFIWGTDGTDGILRMNSSMAWTKDAGNAFVTLAVGNVDCGTI